MNDPQETTESETATRPASATVRTNRREPCPCGSGKKFKNCHEGQPGYEVDAVSAPEVPVPPTGTVSAPAKQNQKHFPGKNTKNIKSQPGFRAYFRNPGG